MQHPERARSATAGFTLIELLVVITIIAILAAMTAPAIVSAIRRTKIKQATVEISAIVQAVHGYVSKYDRLPASTEAVTSVLPPAFTGPTAEDFTYGGSFPDQNGIPFAVDAPGTYRAANSELVAILTDMETFPNGMATVNARHVKNTQRINFLSSAKIVGDTSSPGVGADGVYRDPWGHPYIISFDANSDDKCRDAVYRRQAVSQQQPNSPAGYDGLANTTRADGGSDDFEFRGDVMVWSAGPDGRISISQPANSGANRDNIRSWK